LLSKDVTTDPEKYYDETYDGTVYSDNTYSDQGGTGWDDDDAFWGEIRIPPFVANKFGSSNMSDLCNDATTACDADGDHILDEIKVAWTFQGNYKGNPFLILPTIGVYYYS
jgi:hypothetical protein